MDLSLIFPKGLGSLGFSPKVSYSFLNYTLLAFLFYDFLPFLLEKHYCQNRFHSTKFCSVVKNVKFFVKFDWKFRRFTFFGFSLLFCWKILQNSCAISCIFLCFSLQIHREFDRCSTAQNEFVLELFHTENLVFIVFIKKREQFIANFCWKIVKILRIWKSGKKSRSNCVINLFLGSIDDYFVHNICSFYSFLEI